MIGPGAAGRWAAWLATGCLAAVCASAQTDAEKPPAPEDATGALAAASLDHSARSLRQTPGGGQGKQVRILALSRMALPPGGRRGETAELLTDLYEARGEYASAAAAAEICLKARPHDDALGRRWLALRLALIQTAQGRLALLEKIGRREDYPASLRALAGVEAAAILRGQGYWNRARDQYHGVLRDSDPLDPYAVRGLLALRKAPGPGHLAQARVKLLEGNPAAVDVAWDLAVMLDELRLHEEALRLFGHVWRVAERKGALGQVSHDFVVQYCNAMLSAGRFAHAVATFSPLVARFARSIDLRALLAEANRALDRKAEADKHVDAIEAINRATETVDVASADRAKDLAMFYLVSRVRPVKALMMARLADRLAPGDAVVRRLLAAAELASGKDNLIRQGRQRLRGLLGKDTYAAAFLAEHEYTSGDQEAGRKALLAGLAKPGTGPAVRRLMHLARKHKVAPPDLPGRDGVREAVAALQAGCLDMGLWPEKFLSVTLTASGDRLAPGEAIAVTAKLTNTSAVRVRVGDWGLLSPRVQLTVRVWGPGGDAAAAAESILARWPAPLYLEPGRSVTRRARVDLGAVGAYLAHHPLEELTLTVTGLPDPVATGGKVGSWLPTVPVAPVKIVRAALLGRLAPAGAGRWGEIYRETQLEIVRDIRRGPAARRMRAARQVGSLLAAVRDVELKKTKWPAGLEKIVTKPMLLSMMRALLRDRSPVVRAEMLAALQAVSLGKHILQLLSEVIEDSSPLVRLRVVELIGASGTSGRETIVDYLAQDRSETVRLMASAFQQRAKSR